MSCLWFSELLGVHTYKDTNIFLCVHARSKMTSAECISVLTDGQYQKSPAVIAYQGPPARPTCELLRFST